MKLNLSTLKKTLSDCHISDGKTYEFFKEADPLYIVDRCREELLRLREAVSVDTIYKTPKGLKEITDSVDVSTKKIIQLMAILRVKNGAVQTAS